MSSNRLPAIVVNDSTLADATGLLSRRSQIDFAVMLQQAGVDEIEVSAGEDAMAIGSALCSSQTVIRGVATKGTVDVALRAGLDTVHLFVSLRTSRPILLKTVRQVVTYAVQRGLAVALEGEDASMADLDLIFATCFVNCVPRPIWSSSSEGMTISASRPLIRWPRSRVVQRISASR
jgi:isopropylmalate/homocitrate/citramalate synthase